MELTDTNRSCGLIPNHTICILDLPIWLIYRLGALAPSRHHTYVYAFPGDYGGGETPVPIPNTEVKPLIADGTAWVAVWESRSLPSYFWNPIEFVQSDFFIYSLNLYELRNLSRNRFSLKQKRNMVLTVYKLILIFSYLYSYFFVNLFLLIIKSKASVQVKTEIVWHYTWAQVIYLMYAS